jgi:hypothetical protein
MEFALQLTEVTNNRSQFSRKVSDTVSSSSVELAAFPRAASTGPLDSSCSQQRPQESIGRNANQFTDLVLSPQHNFQPKDSFNS